jgi:hypothetical protein
MTDDKSFWANFTLSLNIDLPAIILFAIMLMGCYVIWKAQQKDGFDFSEMLRDENNKPSAVRIGVLVSLAISSWGLMNHVLLTGPNINPWIYGLYIGGWSGALVFVEAAKKWNGTLPWSK